MENSNKPIYPVFNEWGQITHTDHPDFNNGNDNLLVGLTKREYLSAIALQGILSNSYFPTVANIEEFPQKAIQLADELLKQLNTP